MARLDHWVEALRHRSVGVRTGRTCRSWVTLRAKSSSGRAVGYAIVATWAEFANAEPDLAAFARERMEGRIVYQATLRLDGAPRVHPVSPWIAAGLLCVSFRDTSPKRREVGRDARYALHSAQPWEDHAGEYGEFTASGWLEQISASHPAVMERPGQTPTVSCTTRARSRRRWRRNTRTMRCPSIDGGSRFQVTRPGDVSTGSVRHWEPADHDSSTTIGLRRSGSRVTLVAPHDLSSSFLLECEASTAKAVASTADRLHHVGT